VKAEPGQLFRNRYWVNATSGSSGHPGFFLFDEDEWLNVLASFARSQEWSGVRIDLTQRQRMATIASIAPWHMSAQVAETAKSWWRPSLRLPASDPLDELVHELNDWQPEVLIAYASMTGILAQEQLEGRLRIHPQVVYSASEVLTAATRQRALQAWGDEPFDQYVATETASIATEHRGCRHMHLFEDFVIIEVVDDQYRPVPPGQYGARILATTLFSRTQPLIRYELNDSVQISPEPVTCGLAFSVMTGVQGRVEDSLRIPAVAGGTVLVQPLVFTRIMDVVPVTEWQLVQSADHQLTLLVSGAPPNTTDAAFAEPLMKALKEQGAQVPQIQVQRVDSIPKSASGKAPLIKAYHPTVLGGDRRG
jgi:phenylacetate-coenzyme A ligase PaaK-like adenylate-forming protein